MNGTLRLAIAWCLSAFSGVQEVRANPAAEVAAAFDRLRNATGYSWVTKHSPAPEAWPPRGAIVVARIGRGNHAARVAEGQTERLGVTMVTAYLAAPNGAVPGFAVRADKFTVVADTPDGWLTPHEIASRFPHPRPARLIAWRDKDVYLDDCIVAASLATNIRRPDEELPPLIGDIVAYRREGEEIVGELEEKGVARIVSPRSKVSGQYQRAQVRFRLVAGELRAYTTCLILEATKQPTKLGLPAPPKPVNCRTTTISRIGTTTVLVPPAAIVPLGR